MRKTKPLLLVLGVILTCGLIWILLANQPKDESYIIDEIFSPDGKHSVAIIGNSQPVFPFGPQDISLKIDDCETILSTSVCNDGGEADVKEITWQDDTFHICIGGKEQQDIIYLISFDGETVIVHMGRGDGSVNPN